MNPLKIIQKYYQKDSLAYKILIKHNKLVIKKALEIAKDCKDVDKKFLKEAGMLHDIGIFLTDAPGIGCNGKEPYICHGYLGRRILEEEGFPKHALVCERHTGVGLIKEDILKGKLPLPKRNMLPKSKEEKIICLADKFFSKNLKILNKEKTILEIKAELRKFGEEKAKRFEMLLEELSVEK